MAAMQLHWGAAALLLLSVSAMATAAMSPPSFISMATSVDDSDKQVAATVVPDWLDSYAAATSGRVYVDLSFVLDDASNTTKAVELGALLLQNETQSRPHVELQVPESLAAQGALFTLVSVDPDAELPWDPQYRNILHWLVSNIPASISSSLDNKEIWEVGVENAEYWGPSPPSETHRYYFLLFQQESEINITSISSRVNFSLRDFTREYNLYYPLGGTFFRVHADS